MIPTVGRIAPTVLLLALCVLPPAARANPGGGEVTAGSASIAGGTGTLTITQGSDRAIINWKNFSIGAGELTKFVQPDALSATLNRVVSGAPSSLLGNLQANGRVYLINPNGVLIGEGARIDAGGFLASTLSVSDADFLKNGDLSFKGDSTAAVRNLGAINALGGDVFLIARQVENSGVISAANGTAGLAAGSEVLLTTGGDERLFVQAASLPGTVVNSGTLAGTTAELKAAGGNAYALAINNSGVVRATGSAVRGGQIWLVASGESEVASSGTLDASSATGQGGRVVVTGGHVLLDGGARLDASGATDGGEVFVGGGWQGKDSSVTNASAVVIQPTATIDVSATASGNGGTAVLWSKDYTSFQGNVAANGGPNGGNGGSVETSSHTNLQALGSVDTSAANGAAGSWLLDPFDVTIASSGASGTTFANIFTPTANSVILASNIATALNSGANVTISTGVTGSSNGDINVNAAVSWTANSTLTLSAFRNINLNASLSATGATAGLVLTPNTGSGGGTYSLGNGVSATLSGANPSLTIGGVAYIVINSVGVAGDATTTTLQGMKNALSGHFALGSDIDAMATSGWNAGLGFAPIGKNGFAFTGTFEGFGHTICDLTVHRPTADYNGLFGYISGSTVQNVGMTGASVTGHFYSAALVGYNDGGTVNNSYATGGSISSGEQAGGLVAENIGGGTVSNSYATNSVATTTSGFAGGLVSDNNATISNSWASGTVTGDNNIGGLAGASAGTISNSFAAGNVSGGDDLGGLVGGSNGTVSNSYATGSVTQTRAGQHVGGLIGYNIGAVTNTYATGNVTGNGSSINIGGLVGINGNSNGTVDTSYSTGVVTGTAASVGGLMGDNSGTVTTSYWNSQVNGAKPGIGTGTTTGVTGLTTAQMRTTASFTALTFTTTPGAAGNNWVLVDADSTLNNLSGAAGATYPMLASEYSTVINGDHQLQLMEMALGASYTLRTNIAALSTGSSTDVWTNQGFVPIGSEFNSFAGTFDGLGHTISDFTINRPASSYAGLLGAMGNGSVVQNVGILGGSVTGSTEVGGLVGYNQKGTISNTYATDSVTGGSTDVGGLAGNNSGTISNSYATGSVTGTGGTVGGLAGANGDTITNSYATGSVTGVTSTVGGLLGNNGGSVANSYWKTSVKATGIGGGPTAGATGLTDAQIQQQASFNIWDFSNTWVIYNGFTTPFLRVFMKPLTVTAADTSKSYDGLAFSGGTSVTYTPCPDNSLILGTLAYGGTSQGAINVGSYAITPQGLYSNQQGYIITVVPGTLTVNKVNLTLAGSQIYDGTTSFAGLNLTATGVHGETFTVSGAGASGNLASKDVQTSQALLTVAGLSLGTSSNGGLSGNYNALSVTGSSVNVTPANLTLTGTRVYDGTTVFAGSILTATGVNGESFAMTGTGASGDLSTKNVQTNQSLASFNGLALGASGNGGVASNYKPLNIAVTGSSVSVTPANLILSGTEVYNGTTAFAGANLTATGVSSETFTVTGAGDTSNLATKDVQTNHVLNSVTGLTLGNGNSGTTIASNYNGLTVTGSSVSVTPANLILSGTRVYDGTTIFAGGNLTATGVNSETFTVTGTGDTSNLATKNVQTNHVLNSVTGLTLGNGNTSAAVATNYNGLTTTNSSVSVTAANLTVSTSNVVKTYDGTTTAVGSPIITMGQLFGSDALAFGPLGPSYAFVGKDVGIGNKEVTVAGIGVNDGNAGHNYVLALVNNFTSTINPANLTLSGTQVYNGLTAFAGGNLTATGVNGETFTLTGAGAAGNLATKDVQTNQLLASVTGLALGSGNTGAALATNYNALSTVGSSVSVTPANLILSGTRVYDGSTVFAGSNLTATGVNGESFTVTNAGDTSNLSSKNVQTNHVLNSVTGLTLGSGNTGAAVATNYVALATTNSSVSVTPKPLTIAGFASDDKIYDGTTAAVVATPGTLTGVVPGDTVGFSNTGATFDTKNAGTGKTVTLNGVALTGSGDQTNYTYTAATTDLSDITPATLTYTANLANRLYGSANPGFSGTVTGFVNSETLGAATTGVLAFTSTATALNNVGSYAILGSGLTASNGNYAFVQAAGNATALTISPAPLTVTADNKSRALGVANPPLTATYTGLVNGETAAVVSGLSLATTAVLGSPTGNYPITASSATAPNYTLSFVDGILAVGQNLLTITADNKTKIYGAALPTFTASYAGLVNGDTPSVVTGLQFSTTATASSNVGTFAITPFGGTASSYTLAYVAGVLTINPAALTITANDASRTYGAVNPTFTGSFSGLVNGDTSSVVSGLTFGTTGGTGSNTGTYPITPSNGTAANYTITNVPGTLTINPAPLRITADNKIKVYGAALPAFTATYAGFVNGDTLAAVSGLAMTTTATAASNVGTAAITPAGGTAANYSITLFPGTLSITPAPLTITADDKSKLYGAVLPTFTATYSGLVNGDASSVVSGLTLTTPATAASGVGTSAITPANGTAANYTITNVPGTLAINPAPLTITADNKARAVGVANPPFTATYTGLVNGDTSSVVSGLSLATTAILSSPAGSYPITASSAVAANYSLTFVNGTLGVGQSLLTITADNQTKIYGAALPTFTASYAGLVNGDTSSVVTGLQFSTTATMSSNVGTFAITPFGGTAPGYTLAYVAGVLTINPAALTITAANASRTYGAVNPTFTGIFSGLVNGDTSSVVSGLTLTTPATAASGVGTSAITPANGTAANYTISNVPGTLTINPAPLRITADDKTKVYGAALPAFTATYSGLVNGDASSVVSGLTLTTPATAATGVGTSAITPANGSAANYTITNTPGTLTINPAALTITADNKSKLYGAALPTFTATYSGLVNGDTSSVVSGLTLTTPASAASGVGTSAITPANGTAANYTITNVPGSLAINPAPLTITADNKSRAVGVANPPFTATYTGFVNGDTSSVVSGLSLATTAILSSPAGSYPITASSAVAANYSLTFVNGTLGVTQNLLTITADNQTKIYGAALPTFTASYAGLVNGDTPSVVTGLQFSTTATASSNVGTFAITPFGGTSSSYTLAYGPGVLTINPAALTITANNASRAFGAANPLFTATMAGFVNGDAPSVVSGLLLGTSATASSAGGSYPIIPSGATAQNYTINFVPGALTVVQNLLTITADNKTKTYGAPLPAFTASYAGLLNGDTSSVVTGLQFSTTASVGTNVGIYTITPFGATTPNYSLVYVPGTLTITSAALTIAANNATRSYGAPNPAFGASFTGLVNGDTTAVVSGLAITTPATAGSNVGSYAITPTGATAANYAITFVPGTLTINPASLTIAAASAAREFGAANPAFSATFSGFVNGDAASVVSGLAFTTPATAASPVGDYPVTPLGAMAFNYKINFVAGALHVTAPTVAVDTTPTPVLTIDQQPVIAPGLAVITAGDRLVFVPVGPQGSVSDQAGSPSGSIDSQLAAELGEVTSLPRLAGITNSSAAAADRGPSAFSTPNFGNFEFVTSLSGGPGGAGGGAGGFSAAQLNEPGLYRETTVNMGGYKVIYHEALADARQQTESNTALGSSYREFLDSEHPRVDIVRATPDQSTTGEPANQRTGGKPNGT